MGYTYISGPVTGTSDYERRFSRMKAELIIRGQKVINPVQVNAEMPNGTPYTGYMDMSLAMLRQCDRIYMMSGWESSRGARLERAFAEAYGLEIEYEELEEQKKEPCEFCSLDGIYKLIAKREATFGAQEISIGAGIYRPESEDADPYMISIFFNACDTTVLEIGKRINYCPMCGRKL